jgi:HAD superfamily phosphatase (TIGR01668 family)
VSNLRPSLYVGSVAEITPDRLEAAVPGAEGVIFDLDNTLADHHVYTVSDDKIQALLALHGAGKQFGIISNAGTQELSDNVKVTAEILGAQVGAKIHTVTSFEVGGRIKPHPYPFDKMSEKIGIPKDRLCYVGDQILKDVFGPNRAGYAGSILVAPCSKYDSPGVKYLQRPVEAIMRPFLGLPILTESFSYNL